VTGARTNLLDANAGAALEALHVEVTAHAERGQPVPCHGDDRFLSEFRKARDEAAPLCAPCPVLAVCAAAADELQPTAGVWAGIDYGAPAEASEAS
jgi:hypothetical protein